MRPDEYRNPAQQEQIDYFGKLFRDHEGNPMAVSSESVVHKRVRFEQLAGIFRHEEDTFSLHDIGMGMGDYLKYLRAHHHDLDFVYSGTDIVPEYYSYCREHFPDVETYCRDIAEAPGADTYDYVILSGVFHQMRSTSRRDWEKFAYNLLRNAFAMTTRGLAFNFISPFVDFYQPNVYYCDLMKLLHHIRDDLSRFFVIKHDYALFEFTIYVYPESVARKEYPEEELRKYFSK